MYLYIFYLCDHCDWVSKLSFVCGRCFCFSHLAVLLVCIQTHTHTHTHRGTHWEVLAHTNTQVKIHFITLDSYFQYITQSIKGKSALVLYIRDAERISLGVCVYAYPCAFHTKKRINKDPSERKITVMSVAGGAVESAWWFSHHLRSIGGCFPCASCWYFFSSFFFFAFYA